MPLPQPVHDGALHQAKSQHDHQRRRPAIAQKGQRHAHNRRHAHHHRQVDREIEKEVDRDADDQKLAEPVLVLDRGPDQEHKDQAIKDQQRKGANKTEDEFGNKTELGVNGFKSYRAYWQEHPERDQEWADKIKAQLGEDRFRREIGCEFIIADETLIAPTTLIDLEGI